MGRVGRGRGAKRADVVQGSLGRGPSGTTSVPCGAGSASAAVLPRDLPRGGGSAPARNQPWSLVLEFGNRTSALEVRYRGAPIGFSSRLHALSRCPTWPVPALKSPQTWPRARVRRAVTVTVTALCRRRAAPARDSAEARIRRAVAARRPGASTIPGPVWCSGFGAGAAPAPQARPRRPR